jgi:hypothetical protein
VKRDIRLARLLLAAVVIAVSAATVWQVWATRKRTLAEIDTNNLNLAQALNTYAEGIFAQSAIVLLGVVDRLETEGRGPENLRRMQLLAERQEQLLDQLNGLTILDAQGDPLMQSRAGPLTRSGSVARAYFVHHRDSPSRDVFIGPPIRSRATGEWVVTVSRRLDDGDRKFAGVVVVTLGLQNFLRPFGTIDIGGSGAISLATTAGQLLVRYPYREQDMGRDFSRSPNFMRHYMDTASAGTASFRSELDGTQRLYAFRKSERYPVVTTVALGKDEALLAWRHHALLTLAAVGALLAAVAAVGHRLIVNIKERVGAQDSLLATREALLKANRRLEVQATEDPLTPWCRWSPTCRATWASTNATAACSKPCACSCPATPPRCCAGPGRRRMAGAAGHQRPEPRHPGPAFSRARTPALRSLAGCGRAHALPADSPCPTPTTAWSKAWKANSKCTTAWAARCRWMAAPGAC